MGFFKAYDMRGTYGVDFDLAKVHSIGCVLPSVVGGRRWLVGRDARLTSPAVRDALVSGLEKGGAEVVDIGPATTPMAYFFTAEEDFDGSVMITASHNPPSDNGLKVSRRGALPVGYDSGLAEVERLVAGIAPAAIPPAVLPVSAATDPVRLAKYIAWLKGFTSVGELSFAVDCSDGMASILAHELFPSAVFINDVPDGNFPHHSPNPLLPESREQLASCVRERHLDCGVIFDGDADRCMFVDENGDFIQPDYLIPIIASTFGERGAVIHDVRTSRGAIEAIRELGCEPVIGKVGHAFAKNLLREVDGICGGELAGHYYFRDFKHCDSGELAAMRILSAFAEAKARGVPVSRFMAPICGRYANSGEINFKVEDKDAAIDRVLATASAFGREAGRTSIDGVRIEFSEGWISVRKSNTEPYLRLLIECDTSERLAAWRDSLSSAIRG